MDTLVGLYRAARDFVRVTPELARFRDLPDAPERRDKPHTPVPALTHLPRHFPTAVAAPEGAALAEAVLAAASEIDWLLTYTEDQVGADFLARFGWFELLGPTGHFHAEDMVAFVGYWGPGLRYPWHRHEAEEVYAVVDGACLFEAEGRAALPAGPGDTSRHAPWQGHALRTEAQPVLALTLQAGRGLNDVPEIMSEPETAP